MKFYIIRHGETDWNDLGKIQGQIDNPLNGKGQAQALDKAKYFTKIKPDLLISSHLIRAIETLDIIKEANNWNCQQIIDDQFIERNFGELEGTIAKDYYQINDFSNYRGFEQHEELSQRTIQGLKTYTNSQYNNIIITSHSHTIRSIIITLFPEKYSWDEFEKTKLPNLAVIEIEYNSANDEFILHGIN